MKRYNPHKDGFHHILRIGKRIIFFQSLIIAGLVIYIMMTK